MSKYKCTGPCALSLDAAAYGTRLGKRRERCKLCCSADQKRRDTSARDAERIDAMITGGDTLASFGTEIERACAEAVARLMSVQDAAEELGLEPAQLRAYLSELTRRAAGRGYAAGTAHTQTPTPEGYRIKGVSTLVDGDGNVKARWIKTDRDRDNAYAALLDAMGGMAEKWKNKIKPTKAPAVTTDDLLVCYPMGDPHIGMLSWAPETGENFDLEIAEANLCEAVDRLVALSPASKHALVVNLGDYFHADNGSNTTTAGTRVDVDGRWPRVLRVGLRVMRRIIEQALTKHEHVTVITEIGNHDTHVSIMLATCLGEMYAREPRVTIDQSPAKAHWYRFGKNLIGVTHGDTMKISTLGEVMAADRPEDWGCTRHRYWLTGHVHHDNVIELRGCTVESFRTLAPADAWHKGQGYRSGRDMKALVFHREWGQIKRNIVGIDEILSGLAKAA